MTKEFDESKHRRDSEGKFATKRDLEKIYSSQDMPPPPREFSPSDFNNKKDQRIELGKQEYAILRKEVVRKNAGKGSNVQQQNYAFTSNYFYLYDTTGDDNFDVSEKVLIEGNEEYISYVIGRKIDD